MKKVDFNTLSEMGLLWKINKEILHPLGLALTRNPHTGESAGAIIADDGVWEYSDKSDFQNIAKLNKISALQEEGKLLEYLQQKAK